MCSAARCGLWISLPGTVEHQPYGGAQFSRGGDSTRYPPGIASARECVPAAAESVVTWVQVDGIQTIRPGLSFIARISERTRSHWRPRSFHAGIHGLVLDWPGLVCG